MTIKLNSRHETCWLWQEPDYQTKHSRLIRQRAQDMINNGGITNHSPHAHTLKVLLSYLEDNLIPYTLTALPGKGYIVQVDKDKAQDALYAWDSNSLSIVDPTEQFKDDIA